MNEPAAEPPDGLLPESLQDALADLLGLPDDKQWSAFEDLCRSHPEQRRRLRSVLHQLGGLAIPDRIGDYEVEARIGAGGMGEVFRAVERGPLTRPVALKIIKLGMDCREVLTRFEQERSTLARMTHEAIATIYGAGRTPSGQPYFAMELVDGEPITQFCDRRRLGVGERLDLFRSVCDGVLHAHQKGVIHRDLKPSNILVTERDGVARPKIIDFGLARAIETSDGGRGLTVLGTPLGTPEYMAPEQARGEVERIDTRADVYSLGVVLYELLVGSLPFPSDEIRSLSTRALERVLSEREPPTLVQRLDEIPRTRRDEVAAARGTSGPGLRSALRGDLELIVRTAMSKDPERRYQSPRDLAADLRRHLVFEPIEARPPSLGYRLSRLARRHRAAFVATGLIAVAILAGGIASFVGFRRAADRSEQIAATNVELTESRDRYARLRGVVTLDRTRKAVRDLVPAWPVALPGLRALKNGEIRELEALRPRLENTVGQILGDAWPPPSGQLEAHPLFEELQSVEAQLTAPEYEPASASSERPSTARPDSDRVSTAAELPADVATLPAAELRRWAWQRCKPYVDLGRVFGEERLSLAAARRALERARGDATLSAYDYLDTLAWACAVNGLDDEAHEVAEESLSVCPAERSETARYSVETLRAYIEERPARGDEIQNRIEELRRRIAMDLVLDDGARFLLSTSSELASDIAGFETEQLPLVDERIAWASGIEGWSRDHPRAPRSWAEARAALRDPDGVETSALYSNSAIELEPQTGLVPIGPNPETGLWEFYHLRSAWTPGVDPSELEVPSYTPEGELPIDGQSGLVFVLVPGGTFVVGAQNRGAAEPGFDELAMPDEAEPLEVSVGAFFVSKYEMTQGQWARLAFLDLPRHPSRIHEDTLYFHEQGLTLRMPVENVSWDWSATLLRAHGLDLPTESQWAYAARAGSSTRLWTGQHLASLTLHENLLDQTGLDAGLIPVGEVQVTQPDGFPYTAPVGSFEANAFGLFDVLGNLSEWCRTPYGPYTDNVDPRIGRLTTPGDKRLKVVRGGNFLAPEFAARTERRFSAPADQRNPHFGVRAVRALR